MIYSQKDFFVEFSEPFRIRPYLQIIGERRKSEEETVRAAAAKADMEREDPLAQQVKSLFSI